MEIGRRVDPGPVDPPGRPADPRPPGSEIAALAPPAAPRMPERPTRTPPVARIIEPKGPEPVRRVADRSPRPAPPRVVVRPLPEPPAPIRRPSAPAHDRVAVRPAGSTSEVQPLTATATAPSRALVRLTPAPAALATPAGPAIAAPVGPLAATGPIASGLVSESATEVVELPELCPIEGGSEARSIEAEVVYEPIVSRPPEVIEAGSPGGPDVSTGIGSAAEIEPARSPEIARTVADLSPVVPEPEAAGLDQARHRAPEPLREIGPSRTAWPSARTIFEAQGRRGPLAMAGPMAARSRAVEPEPTDVLAPACWSMPLWLGWFPVLVASVVAGAGGLALAYEWAIEANAAVPAIRMALRPEGEPGSTLDAASIPRGGWWTTTATHQAAWAMALARAVDGDDHSEEVRSLLNSARDSSRLASRSRFVVERAEAPEAGSAPDLSHLGGTRDVVTLVRAGRRLRKQGKVDSAIRAFRSAMEIASKARLEDLAPPTFFEDPQVRRYALPREGLMGIVARALVEEGEWTKDGWADALPATSAASMVTSRVYAGLRKRAEADRLADLAIRQSESPTPEGYDPAEDLAAAAEALAYRGRWTDAAERYRRAIDLSEDDPIRRMWWLNLAEVYQRVGDDPGRTRAIEAARSVASVDEITRRALRYQQGLPGIASSAPRP